MSCVLFFIPVTLSALLQPGTATGEKLNRRVLGGMVWVRTDQKTGTGAFVSRDRKLVLVSLETVRNARNVTVYFPQYRGNRPVFDPKFYRSTKGYKGTVIRRDEKRGIAFIELGSLPARARPLRLAPKSPAPGDEIIGYSDTGNGGPLWVSKLALMAKLHKRASPRPKTAKKKKALELHRAIRGGVAVNRRGELVGLGFLPKTAGKSAKTALDISEIRPLVEKTTDGYYRVKVFYATDRLPSALADHSWSYYFLRFFLTLTGAILGVAALAGVVILMVVALVKSNWRKGAVIGVMVCVAVPGLVASLYALEEATADRNKPGQFYSAERGELRYGTCTVSIPKDHRLGDLEGPPSLFEFKFKENPEEHVVVLGVDEDQSGDAQDFFGDLKRSLRESSEKQILVFIHGYNTTFEDAARRSAQLFYDLEFDGVPVFYSWPSQGRELAYTVDENNASFSVPHFERFLTRIARESGAEQVHVIAHSMGNRILTRALRRMAETKHYGKGTRFRNVVLAAPDVDAAAFKNDFAPQIANGIQRVTLYASSNDAALKKSMEVHGGYPRAGESGANLVVLPNLVTIDVSQLDTSLSDHSYYASHRSVVSDIYQLLRGQPPGKRKLQRRMRGRQAYWTFKP